MAQAEDTPRIRTQILNAWLAPISAGTAAQDIQALGKAWFTLSIVQLVAALYFHLLPSLPFGLSGLPLQHVLYAPVLFILGFVFERFKSRIAALVLLIAIVGETGWHIYSITQMIQADVVWVQVAGAMIWRVLLAWLALRSIKASLLYTP